MPEWTLEDQSKMCAESGNVNKSDRLLLAVKTVHVLFRKGPSLRYVWGSMPAVKIGDKVLELLEARKCELLRLHGE